MNLNSADLQSLKKQVSLAIQSQRETYQTSSIIEERNHQDLGIISQEPSDHNQTHPKLTGSYNTSSVCDYSKAYNAYKNTDEYHNQTQKSLRNLGQ